MMEPDYVWDFHQNCGELKVAGCPSQSRGSEWSVYVMTSKSLVHSIHICCINFSGQNDLYLIAINYLRTVFITADSKLEHQMLQQLSITARRQGKEIPQAPFVKTTLGVIGLGEAL